MILGLVLGWLKDNWRLALASFAVVVVVLVSYENGRKAADRDWQVKYSQLETANTALERDIATARAAGEAAGRAAEKDNQRIAQEASNARAVELAAIATRADDQLRGVLRLCRNPARPVPAAGAGGGPHAADQPAAAAGVVPGGLDPPRTVVDLDVEFLRDRLNRAEQVAADLRTCMAAWPRE